MIYISKDGILIKSIHHKDILDVAFSRIFGFIDDAEKKLKLNSIIKKGHTLKKDETLFNFKINCNGGKIEVLNFKNCRVDKVSNYFVLSTDYGKFEISNKSNQFKQPLFIEDNQNLVKDDSKWMISFFVILLLFMAFLFRFLSSDEMQVEIAEEKKIEEPIKVTVVKPKQKVIIKKMITSAPTIKEVVKKTKPTKKLSNNFSFLGLVGDQKNSKVVGGLKQKLENATAGAGKGGDAGSGGEKLVGLGKGLKKTTVGNTGVAGLGGVGTKGAGGGLGGYGDVALSSGTGKGVGSINIHNEMVLEGGLDKNVIAATIQKYLNQVRACYELGLARKSDLQGKVAVNFIINPKGQINKAKISDTTLKDIAVEKCITNKMRAWKFPKPKGGVNVDVNYPFILRPIGNG